MSVFVQTREVSVGDARYNLRLHLGESCMVLCNLWRKFFPRAVQARRIGRGDDEFVPEKY